MNTIPRTLQPTALVTPADAPEMLTDYRCIALHRSHPDRAWRLTITGDASLDVGDLGEAVNLMTRAVDLLDAPKGALAPFRFEWRFPKGEGPEAARARVWYSARHASWLGASNPDAGGVPAWNEEHEAIATRLHALLQP